MDGNKATSLFESDQWVPARTLTLRRCTSAHGLATLRAFRGVLKKDGWIFIQILNYDRVMKNRERIQNIKEINGKLFIRFYDYTGKTVLFNILTIEKQKNKLLHSIRSVEIRPGKHTELVRSMECAGYRNIKLFGSLTMDAYLNSLSKDLVIVAQQSN